MRLVTKHSRLLCILLLLTGGVLACSPLSWGGGDVDWVESGTHPDYQPPRYMLGVGYGDSMKDADDMARGELTKGFSAKVTSVSLEMESYKQKDQGEASEAMRQFETRTYTRVKGQAVLEDVRIVERRVEGSRHYSLAVVDAAALRAKWTKQLAGLELAMEESLRGSSRADSARIQAIAGALRLLGQRRSLEAQLRAIGGATIADSRDYSALFLEMQRLLAQHHPVILTGNDAEFLHLAAEALGDAWLVVAVPPEGVEPVQTHITLSVEVRDQGNGVELLYAADAQAIQEGRILAQRRVADRLQHKSEEMGRQKVLLELRDKLLKPFADDLAQALLGSTGTQSK